MDNFRMKLSECGPGGMRCKCCRPSKQGGLKDRSWTRKQKRAERQEIRQAVEAEMAAWQSTNNESSINAVRQL